MDATWVSIAKTYLEIGILGLCGILTITIAFLYFKNGIKREQKQDEKIKEKDTNSNQQYDMILRAVLDQNKQNQELLQKQLEELRK